MLTNNSDINIPLDNGKCELLVPYEEKNMDLVVKDESSIDNGKCELLVPYEEKNMDLVVKDESSKDQYFVLMDKIENLQNRVDHCEDLQNKVNKDDTMQKKIEELTNKINNLNNIINALRNQVTNSQNSNYQNINSSNMRINDISNKVNSLQKKCYYTFEKGMIISWYGSSYSVPDGWAICNGSKGTPDLRDKFVIGSGGSYSYGSSGGKSTIHLSKDNLPKLGKFGISCDSHNGRYHHSWNSLVTCESYYSVNVKNGKSDDWGSNYVIDLDNGMNSSGINIMNPYYALFYIMKL